MRLFAASLLVLVLASLTASSDARADVASAHVDIHGGGSGGLGISGDRQDEAFVSEIQGAQAGLIVGAEVFFLDLWVEHNQYFTNKVLGTWTQFMVGLDMEIDVGEATTLGYVPWYMEVGLGLGFGAGTMEQVDPPLDSGQITDKGFVAEGRIGVGYRLNKFLSVGAVVPVQTGYFIKSDVDDAANDTGNHYSSIGASGLIYLRAKVGL